MNDQYFKDQCFVLKSIPFQSTDAHVVLFCKERGKFMVLAKGVGKAGSKFASLLNNGNCIAVDCVLGKGGNTLISCSSIEGFQSRYSCYESLLTGMYICDLVDATMMTGEPQTATFYLLYFCLLAMNDKNFKEIRILFEWKYVVLLGYGSDDTDYLKYLLEYYWKSNAFTAGQQSIYDELSGFLSTFQSEKINGFSVRLSASAYRVIKEVLKRVYHQEAQIYVKSQKVLEQAIGH